MYFEKEENKQRLLNEIKRWRGTLFRYNTGGVASPGTTADCASFPLGVLKNVGLIEESLTVEPYISLNGGKQEYIKMIAILDSLPGWAVAWDSTSNTEMDIKFGDLIICSSGHAVHHILIATGTESAWHCWPCNGVSPVPLRSGKIIKHLKRIYRFTGYMTDEAKH